MSTPLNALIIDDRPEDAELLVVALTHADYAPTWVRVDNERDYLMHLNDSVEIILADYSMPQFSVGRALDLLHERDLDIPFIVVTGSVTEKVLEETLRRGAVDYLIKDRLGRLAASVNHALEEKLLRNEKRRAELALRDYAVTLEQRVEQRTSELRQFAERVEAILNTSSDGIVVTDADGLIVQTNPAFEALFDFHFEFDLQVALIDFSEMNYDEGLTKALREVLSTRRPQRIEIVARSSKGITFAADVAMSAINVEGSPQGVVCSIRDISHLKRIEADLRKSLEAERELSELKSRFISMASHEFRTPLATILVTVEALWHYWERFNADDRDKRFQRIQEQIKHMTALLEDVLTISRAESSTLEFHPVSLDINALSRQIVDEFRQTARTHELEFAGPTEAIMVSADPKLLRQALINLLTNAVKYSPEKNAIAISLTCEPKHVCFTVQDHGIGIPVKDQKYLFQPFHRSSNVGTIQGTGLGLAIVKQAIDLHGGEIVVESEVGKGSTFTLLIPT